MGPLCNTLLFLRCCWISRPDECVLEAADQPLSILFDNHATGMATAQGLRRRILQFHGAVHQCDVGAKNSTISVFTNILLLENAVACPRRNPCSTSLRPFHHCPKILTKFTSSVCNSAIAFASRRFHASAKSEITLVMATSSFPDMAVWATNPEPSNRGHSAALDLISYGLYRLSS